MSEAGPAGAAAVTLDALRARGAQRWDPVRFRYLEALSRRAAAHEGDTRQWLDRRLAVAMTAFGTDHERAMAQAGEALTGLVQRFPAAAAEFRQLHLVGDIGAMRRLAARLEAQHPPSPLAELLRHLDGTGSAQGPARPADPTTPALGVPGELRALKHFRGTWTRLSVDRQLTRSRAQAPENPGPLNSHGLVLRSLQTMQDLSPAYLKRFMAYADALLWIDQAHGGSDVSGTPGPAVRREADRKRKPGRGKAG